MIGQSFKAYPNKTGLIIQRNEITATTQAAVVFLSNLLGKRERRDRLPDSVIVEQYQ